MIMYTDSYIYTYRFPIRLRANKLLKVSQPHDGVRNTFRLNLASERERESRERER